MSGFDENPFGEPNVNDPFADPAVRKAASSVQSKGIDDYNPFANQTGATGPQVRGAANPPIYGGTATQPQPQLQQQQPPSYGGTAAAATQQPAMLQTSSQEAPPPNYTRTPQQTIPQSSSGMFSPTSQPPNEPWRRNTQDMSNGPYYPRRNNWPPLPESCCVQPCFYQDIDVEIQPDFQKIVRQLYYLWIFHALILVLNVVVGFILLMAKADFRVFGLGLVYLILFTPFSFLCWFRPVYQAFKSDSSFNFMVFFFIFFFQSVISVFQSIGFPDSGTCGIVKALMMFSSSAKDMFLGILMLIIACGFVAAATGDIILLTKVHRIYRSTGASVSKAQQEFTSNFMRNEHVQQATANIAASAVRNQVNNLGQQQQQPRY